MARICEFLPRRNTEATQQLTAAKHLRKRAGSNLVLNRSRSYLEPMLLECCNVNTFWLLQLCEGIPGICELEVESSWHDNAACSGFLGYKTGVVEDQRRASRSRRLGINCAADIVAKNDA